LANIGERRFSDINSIHNKLGALSEGDILQDNRGKVRNYSHSIIVTLLSKKKKGRRFTITKYLYINNRFNRNATESDLTYIYPTVYDSMYAQLRREDIKRTDLVSTFNYSEPINKVMTIRINGRYELGIVTNDIGTYNKNGGPGYTELNPAFSSLFKRTSNRLFVATGLEFKWKDLTITPLARVLFQHVDNDLASMSTSIRQKQNDILPSFSLVYKQLNINYSRDVSLPSFTYLLPVQDNTNPYYIVKGNTGLVPATRDNYSVGYNLNNTKKNIFASLYVNGAFTKDDFIQAVTVDDQGVQTTVPVNADGSKSFYSNFNFNKQYKQNPKFIFSWNVGGNIGFNRSRMFYNNAASWQSNQNFNIWLGVNLNWNDKIELNNSWSPAYNATKYTNPAFRKVSIRYQWIENELIIRWPKHIIWETQTNYTYNSNTPQGTPKSILRWNAAINLTMLRDEVGVLKLSAFDLLNRNRNINSYTNRNVIYSSETNALSQYVMLTFTYNVRAAGVKKKIGGWERLFFF
jgi:hypothetical protein